jgi:hypothetical protein
LGVAAPRLEFSALREAEKHADAVKQELDEQIAAQKVEQAALQALETLATNKAIELAKNAY